MRQRSQTCSHYAVSRKSHSLLLPLAFLYKQPFNSRNLHGLNGMSVEESEQRGKCRVSAFVRLEPNPLHSFKR